MRSRKALAKVAMDPCFKCSRGDSESPRVLERTQVDCPGVHPLRSPLPAWDSGSHRGAGATALSVHKTIVLLADRESNLQAWGVRAGRHTTPVEGRSSIHQSSARPCVARETRMGVILILGS